MVAAMRQSQTGKHSLLIIVTLLSSNFAQANTIFERATCPQADYVQCANTGLPSDFCCPSTSTCIALAQNTTLLCCPSGSDCSTIQPITCDITQQNITSHPENTLKTTALTATLEQCGSNCCPFGYTCVNGNCQMNADQADSVPGQQQSSAGSTGTSSIATSSGTQVTATSGSPSFTNPSSTSTPSSTGTPITIIPKTCDKYPVEAILIGLFPGIAIGALLALLTVCCLGRRKPSQRKSGSSFGNISDPVPTSYVRTDFLRKMPQTPSTSAGGTPRRNKTITRVQSLFRKSTATGMSNSPTIAYQNSPPPALPIPLNIQRNKQMQVPNRPITPPLQREPSFEDINIFTDADTASSFRQVREQQNQTQSQSVNHLGVPPTFGIQAQERGSHNTTFTDMLEKSGLAGLQKGQPYVYRGSVTAYTPSPPQRDRMGK
ncbi:hypothetical protein BCIN_01g03810 [Botrytis cinerea B05.10]|uniref:Uncharacterized protein n=1 Tax=Botryotinia fuckeliana (strain B05.10) TaxID=332648 RepID=A0A384J529_BOTFB|nr:hypothetical protein BCIN_01g03810 [Botrytis cinerea B05.10]ATZ45635.1 hypothetical protein BCIN_01g03810 [Botrytis cinerea B05.10]